MLVLCLLIPIAYSQTSFKGCKAEGTAKTKKNKAQNILKNRDDAPDQIDESVTLRELMLKANDKKFDPDTGVEVTGFVVDVTPGGKRKPATVPERISRTFISMLFKDEATPKTSDGISSWR